MTTIILVAIGVLIAAVAALMVIFYGGDAYNSADVKAQAARLVTEGQQISYATDLYYRQEDKLPGNGTDGTQAVKDLVAKDYLPIMPQGTIDKAGVKQPWKMEYGNDGMIYSRLGTSTDEASLNVCRAARKQLNFPDFTKVYQCDGSDYPVASWKAAGTLPEREPCCIRASAT